MSSDTRQPDPTKDAHAFSRTLPCLVLGGAGFSNLTHPNPEAVPVAAIVRQAFDQGIRTVDTAPFYEPSEQLLGKALADPLVTDKYARADYVLMTKVGREGREAYDYTPAAVAASVRRSLARLGTSYLDVVFCHDIEHVTEPDVLDAVGALLPFVEQGAIRFIGLSGYRLDVLSRRARLLRERYGRPVVDVVQNWGQLTLQNSKLETSPDGLAALKAAGVAHVFSSSPLCMGLLRKEGVPVGKLGEWHPAPAGLRAASHKLAEYMASQGESLASVALRYALWRAHEVGKEFGVRVSILTGIGSVADLAENVEALRKIVQGPLNEATLDVEQVERDKRLFAKAHEILGEWVDWSYTIPAEGWDPELKRMVRKPE